MEKCSFCGANVMFTDTETSLCTGCTMAEEMMAESDLEAMKKDSESQPDAEDTLSWYDE